MTLIPWDKSCVSSGDSFFLWGIATELLTLARDSNEFLFAWPKTSWLGLRLLYLELLMTHILTNQWKTFSLKPTPLFNVFNIQSRADIGLTFCKQSTCGQPSVATTTHFLHYQLAHPFIKNIGAHAQLTSLHCQKIKDILGWSIHLWPRWMQSLMKELHYLQVSELVMDMMMWCCLFQMFDY